MRLTVQSDYALRVLIYLGLTPTRLSTVQEIADAYGISKNHLMKIAHQLGLAGYIDTVRGRGGGLRLRKSPETIKLGAVLRLTEEDFSLVECFVPATNSCTITRVCSLRKILNESLEAFFSVLDAYTLKDLMANKKGLSRILEIEMAR